MKTPPNTRIFVVLCAVAFASCAKPPESTRMPVSASLRPDASSTGRLHQEVNAYRQSNGASQLQRHAGLDSLAQKHCEFLRNNRGTFVLHGKNVSHSGFEGRALIAREHYRMENISENVAATTKAEGSTSQRLIALWKNSKDHHKNMLDDWTHTGVGVVVDSDGMVFATQLFSTVTYSHMASRERFFRF